MRDWESEFIELWTAGVEAAEITRRLGIPLGTVHSRAGRLRQEGKITARPRGGAYPLRRVLARQEGARVSSDTPGVSRRVSDDTSGVSTGVSPDTPLLQYLPPAPDEMRPLLQDILLELR